jgi:hypothetical protein
MGQSNSSSISTILDSDTLQSYLTEYSVLGLTKEEICLFHNIFRLITGDDEIFSLPIETILRYYEIPITSFTRSLFTSFDIDLFQLEYIDFPRFLQAIWNICTLEDHEISSVFVLTFYLSFSFFLYFLGYFLFSLYDVAREDYLQKQKIISILIEMYDIDFQENDDAVTLDSEIFFLT